MAETRPYNGATYEKQPDGSWRKVSRGSVIRDPYRASEEARKAEDQALQRGAAARSDVQLGIALRGEDRAERQAALDAEAKAEKLAAEREERARLEAAQRSAMGDAMFQLRTVIDTAKNAKEMAKSGAGIGTWEGTEGYRDSMLLGMSGLNASSHDMAALLSTIGSNTAFDRLQKMRDESPTGGALGAVSEVELRLLRDSLTSLSQTQSEKQFEASMDKVIEAYGRVAGKLQSADQYYRNNGSMEGYVPPSEEELRQYSFGNIPDPQSAAGAGATEQNIPIPPEMQAEWDAYTRSNWGSLDPQAYAQFRAGLDQKYGFGDNDPSIYAQEAQRLNNTAAQGGLPGEMAIPSVTRDLSAVDQARNELAASGPGTALGTYLNAGGFGIPSLVAGEQLGMMREESPWWAASGDILGGATGAGLFGKGLGLATANLGGRGAQFAANPLAAELGYGATFGATTSDDPVTGALIGAGSALVGDQIGGQIARRLPGAVGMRRPVDPLTGGERAVLQTAGDTDPVLAALAQADELGVPMALADASPELASVAGSATRFSPTVAGQARNVMGQRNQGQMDRLGEAVARDLGPIENIPQRSEDLLQQARTQADPLYEQAYAAPGASSVNLEDMADRPMFKEAMERARAKVLNRGEKPESLGFDLDDFGEVILTGTPSWRTMDEIKRALDDVIKDNTSKMDGMNSTAGTANDMRKSLLGRMDKINPTYKEARAVYADPVTERSFLARGQAATKVLPNQLGVDMARMTPEQKAQMRLGFQSNIMDTAGNLRNNSNPFAQLNTPNTEGRLAAMYGGDPNADIARLLTQRDLELDLAGNSNRLIGNSATAERGIADEMFKQQPGMMGDVGQGIAETALLGGPWLTVGQRVGDRMFKQRREANALAANRQLADEIGPLLLNTDPAAASQALTDLSVSDEAYQVILDELLNRAQRRGGQVGAGALSAGVVGSAGY